MLLKLHSQLSGVPDSYNPDEEESETSTANQENIIGDGPFFVAKLLNKIATLDNECRQCIQVRLIIPFVR